jgi:predicted deacetylase
MTTEPMLCVSIHDVAPATWPACQRVLDAVRQVAPVPLTLLVVPAYHGRCSALVPGFVTAMDECVQQGHELALHGYFHADHGTPRSPLDAWRRCVYTAREGEFCGLDEAEAAERLLLGERWFRANGWPLAGFVPPAWLLGDGAWRALRAHRSLRYVTTLRHFHLLPTGPAIAAPCLALSARSATRRAASTLWAAVAPHVLPQRPLLRLALHPHDADSASLTRAWQRALERWLRGRQAVTKAIAAARLALAVQPRPMSATIAANIAGERAR